MALINTINSALSTLENYGYAVALLCYFVNVYAYCIHAYGAPKMWYGRACLFGRVIIFESTLRHGNLTFAAIKKNQKHTTKRGREQYDQDGIAIPPSLPKKKETSCFFIVDGRLYKEMLIRGRQPLWCVISSFLYQYAHTFNYYSREGMVFSCFAINSQFRKLIGVWHTMPR